MNLPTDQQLKLDQLEAQIGSSTKMSSHGMTFVVDVIDRVSRKQLASAEARNELDAAALAIADALRIGNPFRVAAARAVAEKANNQFQNLAATLPSP